MAYDKKTDLEWVREERDVCILHLSEAVAGVKGLSAHAALHPETEFMVSRLHLVINEAAEECSMLGAEDPFRRGHDVA